MNAKSLRVGLIGAGYIAEWHAQAIAGARGMQLTAVCDLSLSSAEAIATGYGGQAFGSVEALLEAEVCDAVHVLTPPQLHRDIAVQCLKKGLHVFVEKPFALEAAHCREIGEAARNANRIVAVNHNFLALPSYERLKRRIAAGDLGPIDVAEINWRFPLPPLRSGPFGAWMLREPRNLLLELGPHLFAFAIDLFGPLSDIDLSVGRAIDLPGGARLPQSWHIRARGGATDVLMHLSLVEGIDDRSLRLRGATGAAHLDFAADTLVVERSNASDIIVSPLRRELSVAGQHLREGAVNAWRQLSSLNRRSPYALGFNGAVAAFARSISEEKSDPRFTSDAAADVIGAIETTLEQLPPPEPAIAVAPPAPAPDVESALVIGGTGFIGRALVRALAASGRRVRVFSRGRFNPFADLGAAVEMTSGSLSSGEDLQQAMEGAAVVYHLAKAEEASWDAYLANDVAVTERIAEAALATGVPRFVYTGTIDSYDASKPERTIDEDTGFEADMTGRNLYARSKALCEERLSALHRERGLPLVIARPGIVLGKGGPLQHWGIGRWHGPGAVRIWGDGRNVLPLVLVDDVADALVTLAEIDGVEGESFNLIGDPLLSARDYFGAIEARQGARINVKPGSIPLYYAADVVKYGLKRFVLRRRGLSRPTYSDWKSRTQASPFSNEKAKRRLNWAPEGDRERFIARATSEADLFGF